MSRYGFYDTTRFLLVGLGFRGLRTFYPALSSRTAPSFCVSAACDPDPERQRVFRELPRTQKARPRIPCFSSLQNLPPDLFDVAIIATPTDQHHAVVKALSASKRRAILVEKPVASSALEAEKILSQSPAIRVLTDRHYWRSFEIVQSMLPELGPLRRFDAMSALPSPNYKNTWRNSPIRAGGGVLLDLGYHLIDMSIGLLGMPETVRARERSPRRAGYLVEEDVEIELLMPSHSATLRASRIGARRREIYALTGKQGTLTWSRSRVTLNARGRQSVWPVHDWHRSRVRRMISAQLAAAAQSRFDERALKVQVVIDALYRSLRQGGALLLTPTRDKMAEMCQ
jgi:predicted dehydrogenase